jgi:hypothetical protein
MAQLEPKEWQPGINISTQNLGTMYVIEVGDRLTHQALLLTPAEVAELRQVLAAIDDPTLDEPARNREGTRLKALTLYNGHSLPTVDRETFEAENTLISKPFYFEVIQVSEAESGEVRRKVGEL